MITSEPISSILRALGFLSRIPVGSSHFGDGHRASDDAHVYPLAGLVISLPAALLVGLAAVYPHASLLLATLAVAATVIITGALHEDGLGDVADGFFATTDRTRMLEIMRDPHLGTFGTLALILSILLRVVCLGILIENAGAVETAMLLMATEALSRSALVWHWFALPNARPGGKADHAGQPSQRQVQLSLVFGMAIFTVASFLAQISVVAAVMTVICAAIAALLFKTYCIAKLGGHTGDTVGATQQIVVLSLLALLAISTVAPN
ncbi:MAG: adenosylcobinamide-GDP ribazoletransferase [Pseudomonadota bacterium]